MRLLVFEADGHEISIKDRFKVDIQSRTLRVISQLSTEIEQDLMRDRLSETHINLPTEFFSRDEVARKAFFQQKLRNGKSIDPSSKIRVNLFGLIEDGTFRGALG